MTSQNEFYFKSMLKKAITEFIKKLPDDHDLGWFPENIESNMAEAAWLVIVANKDIQEFIKKEQVDL